MAARGGVFLVPLCSVMSVKPNTNAGIWGLPAKDSILKDVDFCSK